MTKKFAEIIKSTKPNKPVNSILDLGCGTGLMEGEARSFCKKLVGIDLSGEMLKQAKNKGIYDQLIETDILKYLSEEKLNYDYFIAADVFIYIGDLSDVFRLIKSKNNRSGRLMFSTEHLEGRGFFLENLGDFLTLEVM